MIKKTIKRYKNIQFLAALGAHCKKIRVSKGYSIDRLAKEGEQLGPAAIQRLETGEADVQVSVLYRYAEVLSIPIAQLFEFEFDSSSDHKDLIIPFESDEKPPRNSVPFYPIHISAGKFDFETADTAPSGWVQIHRRGPLKDYFSAQITGHSMMPTIPPGSLCLFKKYTGGSRDGKIMLIQHRGLRDPETGNRFVVKRYQRITLYKNEGDEDLAVTIHLLSDNPKYPPLVLHSLREDEISSPAVFVEVIA
jgi:transcriptional regulator with XRE-family HTH domain